MDLEGLPEALQEDFEYSNAVPVGEHSLEFFSLELDEGGATLIGFGVELARLPYDGYSQELDLLALARQVDALKNDLAAAFREWGLPEPGVHLMADYE